MDNQKVILITGCSSGFGLLTAVRLAAKGHFVWATMRDLSKSQCLEEGLAKQKTQAQIRQLDVTQPETIQRVVEEILQQHTHIDVLINNAGYGVGGFFEDLSEADIRQQMEVNFFGVQNVCRTMVPLMRERRKGQIINISSIAGLTASPSFGAYSASKWALEGFSESLHHELKLFNIDVVLVEPGTYPTEFKDKIHYAAAFDNPQSPYFSMGQKLKTLSLDYVGKLKRDPQDVARLIERIIELRNPKLRYISDFPSWLYVLGRRFLPQAVYGHFFRKVIHANPKHSV